MPYSVEKSKFQWKHHSVRDLDMSVVLFHVFEPLQMKGQYVRESLYPHAFLLVNMFFVNTSYLFLQI